MLDAGKASTAQCAEHLKQDHFVVCNSRRPLLPQAITNHYEPLHAQTPAAETFVNNFIDWVVAEDITFSQASSNRL